MRPRREKPNEIKRQKSKSGKKKVVVKTRWEHDRVRERLR